MILSTCTFAISNGTEDIDFDKKHFIFEQTKYQTVNPIDFDITQKYIKKLDMKVINNVEWYSIFFINPSGQGNITAYCIYVDNDNNLSMCAEDVRGRLNEYNSFIGFDKYNDAIKYASISISLVNIKDYLGDVFKIMFPSKTAGFALLSDKDILHLPYSYGYDDADKLTNSIYNNCNTPDIRKAEKDKYYVRLCIYNRQIYTLLKLSG